MQLSVAHYQPMTTIKLSGSLAAKFGRVHRRVLDSGQAWEAFRALKATLEGFKEEIQRLDRLGMRFAVFRNRKNVGEAEFGLGGATDKRLALEQRLAASEQTHFEKMTDAQKNQDRLRDRLATSDLRLSVLLDATDAAKGCGVPATTSAGGVDHAAIRARLDPAHAQRIIAITDEGDRGLIALQACQDYIRPVSH